MQTTTIAEPVLAALSAASFEGDRLVLTSNLDRKLYEQVAKVIEAAGGKWERRAKAHLFPTNAQEAIEPILLEGRIPKKTEKQRFEAFFTPPPVVALVVAAADLQPGHLVLEPSAGHGALVRAALSIGCSVEAYEINPASADVLIEIDGRLYVEETDFLTVPVPERLYDRVIMNPPFGRQTDIDHVRHAFSMLKPGGRLVSVMSAGVRFRQDRKATAFRELVMEHRGNIRALPEGSFSSSGTEVNTVLVTILAKP